jgi:hypothetical protein
VFVFGFLILWKPVGGFLYGNHAALYLLGCKRDQKWRSAGHFRDVVDVLYLLAAATFAFGLNVGA